MSDKEIVWLHGEVKTPPFSSEARIEAGHLLRLLQQGKSLSMPQSRLMRVVGVRCHELRIRNVDLTSQIILRIDADAVVILEVFEKKTTTTPKQVIQVCENRLALYDSEA